MPTVAAARASARRRYIRVLESIQDAVHAAEYPERGQLSVTDLHNTNVTKFVGGAGLWMEVAKVCARVRVSRARRVSTRTRASAPHASVHAPMRPACLVARASWATTTIRS